MKRCPIHDPPEKRDEADNIMDVTEEEIISLWRSLQIRGRLDENEAWNVIVAGIALEMAFQRPHATTVNIEH